MRSTARTDSGHELKQAAVIFTLVVVAVDAALERLHFGERTPQKKVLRIVVPESLDYEGVFMEMR